MTTGKLGIVVDGSGWLSANVIGSLYPQPAVANIGLLDEVGVTILVGAAPTKIGSPVLGTGYQTLNADGPGYDTGISDVITKTMMFVGKPVVSGTLRSLGMGSYHGGNGTPPVPQGDTFVVDPVSLSLRAIGSTASGTAQSQLNSSALDFTKFQVYVADFSATGVQVSVFKNGAVVKGPLTAAASRALPASTLRIGAAYDIHLASGGLNGPIQMAGWGLWTGVNLTDAEKLRMYNTFKSRLSSKIVIS